MELLNNPCQPSHKLTTATAMDPFLLACLLLSILAHQLLRRLLDRGKPSLPLPPGPRGIPILGSLPLIGGAPHSSLANLARRYGPIMYLKLGTSGVVVASTPSAARAFLKASVDVKFANRPHVASQKDLTYDYQEMTFSSYGPKLKLFRRLSTIHLLSGKAMADWAHVRLSEVGHLVHSMLDSAPAGRPVVVSEALVCATANILGRITMSRRVFDNQGKESKELKHMLLELLSGTGLSNIGDFIPSIAWMDLQGVQARNKKIHEKFDGMITRMLEEHAATAAEREGRPDFVDLIRANREWEGETLSDVNIKGLVFNLFSAGTDTASVTIEWAIAELIKNPTLLQRAQSEMDQVIGRDRRLEESDLPNLPYLQAVCKEAFRKHPSTPLSLPHYTFDECEVEGYYIPKNTRLLINIWAIGRDPDTWENPLEFDPERFLSGKGAKIEPQGNDFELIPFGAGRRICVGKQAGLLFVQYILGTLVHSFDWRLQDGEELSMDELPGLVLPKAVPVSALVTPRLAPAAYI